MVKIYRENAARKNYKEGIRRGKARKRKSGRPRKAWIEQKKDILCVGEREDDRRDQKNGI